MRMVIDNVRGITERLTCEEQDSVREGVFVYQNFPQRMITEKYLKKEKELYENVTDLEKACPRVDKSVL